MVWISSLSQPRRMASPMQARRSGVATASASLELVVRSRPMTSTQPPSRLLMALSMASWKVPPMPITSPTARMAVPRVRSVTSNFSKFQRGIFTMT